MDNGREETFFPLRKWFEAEFKVQCVTCVLYSGRTINGKQFCAVNEKGLASHNEGERPAR